MNFDRKLRTPKCEILMCIYRKSECESERNGFPATFALLGWLAKECLAWLVVSIIKLCFAQEPAFRVFSGCDPGAMQQGRAKIGRSRAR